MERWPTPQPSNEIFKFQIWPAHGKMTNPQPSLMKFLNIRFGLDMERWLTLQPSLKFLNFRFCLDPQPSLNIFKLQIWPGHEKMTDPPHSPNNFKFQIWPGHGKMPNPPTLNEIFKFQIWPGPPTLTEYFSTSDLAWTWKDDWPPKPHQNFNFRFGLNMVRCPTLQPSLKFLNFRFDLDPQPSLKFLNFRYGLDMKRWMNPQPHQTF